jgi:hypothetical protein
VPFYGCSGLTHPEIPSSVTRIWNGAFWKCSGLSQLEIGAGVTTIAKSSFRDCSGLMRLEIPSSVTTIGEHAFSCCYGLTVLKVPSSVTTIGECAFCGCSGLTQLWNFAKLGQGVFTGGTKLEQLTLVGSVLSQAVVATLEECLTPTARVIGASLVARRLGPSRLGSITPGCDRFGRFAIVTA